PAEGRHRPFSVRIRVDLPEPERPITTKISPSLTSNEASMTAAVTKPASETSLRVDSLRILLTASAGRRPKTLSTSSLRWTLTLTSQSGRLAWDVVSGAAAEVATAGDAAHLLTTRPIEDTQKTHPGRGPTTTVSQNSQ